MYLPHLLITFVICVICGSQPCIKDENSEHCYQIVDILVTWNQALNICGSDGSNLAIIETAEEQQFIAGQMQKRVFKAPGLWIGSDKVYPEENRTWVNGEKFSYANWAKGEPNFPPAEENCAEMFTSSKWNDNVCTYFKGYICEKTYESELCIKDQTTGHCYQIVDKKATWAQAFNICREDNGTLIIIESADEQMFIGGKVQGINFSVDGLWMGSNTLYPEKQRTWIDGKNFTYANWAEGEPNNSPHVENCAEINTTDSSWNDYKCEYMRGYICEKTLPGTSQPPGWVKGVPGWVIGVAVGSVLVLFMGILLLCCLMRKRRKSKKENRDETYQDVQEMETNNIEQAYNPIADLSDTYCTIDDNSLSEDETHRKEIYRN